MNLYTVSPYKEFCVSCLTTDACIVDSCQDALSNCQNDNTCKILFDEFVNKCNSILKPNCSDPVCPDDCKQAIDNLYNDDNGYKLKCCDCGSPNQQGQFTTIRVSLPPGQCFMERYRLINHCAVDHDDCINCKDKGNVCFFFSYFSFKFIHLHSMSKGV